VLVDSDYIYLYFVFNSLLENSVALKILLYKNHFFLNITLNIFNVILIFFFSKR